jgi:hypothetical protein
MWKYGIQLWGCTKPSNTKIIQRFQSKVLRLITNAPWYVSNLNLHKKLRGLSPQANSTDRATAAVGEVMPTFVGSGCYVVSATDSHGR